MLRETVSFTRNDVYTMADERKSPTGQQAEGNWNQFKGRLREAWGDLTDDDLDKAQGKRDQLVGQIQEKTGESREEIRKRIDNIAEKTKYQF